MNCSPSALLWLALTASANAVPVVLFAHPGGVDDAGGHVNRKTGIYHFHRVGGKDGSKIDPKSNLPTQPNQPITSTTASVAQKRRAAREHAAAALFKAALQAKRKATAVQAVADLFPETKAGERARRTAARLADPDVSAVVPADQQEKIAKERAADARVQVARRLFSLGEDALAVEVLRETVTSFPETEAANAADELLHPETPQTDIDLPDGGFFDEKLKPK